MAVARRGAVVILKYIYWWGLVRTTYMQADPGEGWAAGMRLAACKTLANEQEKKSQDGAPRFGARLPARFGDGRSAAEREELLSIDGSAPTSPV